MSRVLTSLKIQKCILAIQDFLIHFEEKLLNVCGNSYAAATFTITYNIRSLQEAFSTFVVVRQVYFLKIARTTMNLPSFSQHCIWEVAA